MARSIIGDTAAASGKPAPRRIRLPVRRKPADPIPTPECPRAIVVEREDALFQIGLCDDADDPAPSLMPPEPIVPDEITGLSRARHLPKLVRQ
jgi:hypothetical protein